MPTEIDALRIREENDTTTSMLYWTYPHLLYSSQRLRTDMGMFIEHSLHSVRYKY